MPPRHLRPALSGVLFASGLASIVASASTPAAGEKWRLTSSSSMGMPGQTTEICLPKRAATQGPPTPPQQKSCTVSGMQRSGAKQTMHMRCETNGQIMEGDMESESLGPDHYRTTMHVTMSMGKFDMVSEYQKLEGSCDASTPLAPTGAAMPPGAMDQGASGETPPWAKPGAMDAARAQAKERAEAEAAQAPKDETKDKLKSKLKGLIGF